MNLKFGYMPGTQRLVDEIEFAKKHFDFLELTYPPVPLRTELSELEKLVSDQKFLEELKPSIGVFPTLGHLYWFNFFEVDNQTRQIIGNSINTLGLLGIKLLTVHPSNSKSDSPEDIKLTIEMNIKNLTWLNQLCQDKGITLLIENKPKIPFDRVKGIDELFNALPNVGITFDTGHTNMISEEATKEFANYFKDKIRHTHLHYNIGQNDHVPYENIDQIKKDLKCLDDINYSGTVTLEIFLPNIDGKTQDHRVEDRQKLLLEQLNLFREALI